MSTTSRRSRTATVLASAAIAAALVSAPSATATPGAGGDPGPGARAARLLAERPLARALADDSPAPVGRAPRPARAKATARPSAAAAAECLQLRGTAVPLRDRIALGWAAEEVTPGSDVVVERRLPGASAFTRLVTLPASARGYADRAVDPGVGAAYRLVATFPTGTRTCALPAGGEAGGPVDLGGLPGPTPRARRPRRRAHHDGERAAVGPVHLGRRPAPGHGGDRRAHPGVLPRRPVDQAALLGVLADPDPAVEDDETATVLVVGADGPVSTRLGQTMPSLGSPTSLDLRQAPWSSTSDVTGDGVDDLLAIDGSGVLWAYPGSSSNLSPVAPRTRLGAGWGVFRQVLAAGDWTGDGRGDLLAKDASGQLWLYPSAGAGRFATRLSLGGGWGPYVLASAGDVDGDTHADLLARDGAGVLWRYPGRGRTDTSGSAHLLRPRVRLGAGWGAFDALLATGDVTGDGARDLVVRRSSDKTVLVYPGTGAGAYRPGRVVATGGQTCASGSARSD